MTPTERQRTVAGIKMWMVRSYMRSLAGFFSDDPGVFGRMVAEGGRPLDSAHPRGWAQHIVNCAVDAGEFYREELEAVHAQLRAWGLYAETPAGGDD